VVAPLDDWEVPYSSLVIQDPISDGTFSKVYKGIWYDTVVAVKVLRKFISLNPQQIDQDFRSDCKFLRSLTHPNIVQTYAYSFNTKKAIVMEYMPLGTLKSWIMVNQMDVLQQNRLDLLIDIAKGMEFIHSRRCLHRNLKSSKILLDYETKDSARLFHLKAKIADVGLAHERNPAQGSSYKTQQVGKETYSVKADVHAYGMIICHLHSPGKIQPMPLDQLLTSNLADHWKEIIKKCTGPSLGINFAEILKRLLEFKARATGFF